MGLCCPTLSSPGSSSPSYKFSVKRETYGKNTGCEALPSSYLEFGPLQKRCNTSQSFCNGEFYRKPFSRILTLFAQEENTTNFAVNGMGNVRGSMHNKVTVNGFPSILLVTRNRYPAQGYFS